MLHTISSYYPLSLTSCKILWKYICKHTPAFWTNFLRWIKILLFLSVASWPSNSSHYRNTAVTTVKNGNLPHRFHCSVGSVDPWQETERGFQRQCVCTSLVSSPTLSFLSHLHSSTSFFPFSFRFYSLPYLSDARRTHSTREFAKVNAFFLPFPSREPQFIIPPWLPCWFRFRLRKRYYTRTADEAALFQVGRKLNGTSRWVPISPPNIRSTEL